AFEEKFHQLENPFSGGGRSRFRPYESDEQDFIFCHGSNIRFLMDSFASTWLSKFLISIKSSNFVGMEEFVVLINEKDEQLGLMEKQQAHVAGLLHRAFSVFVFNSKGEVLLQQRAHDKYHSPLLWTNTCCSHPREGETYEQAAHRRLRSEEHTS